MGNFRNKLKKTFPKIIFNESLKTHCTYYTGGKADFFYELKDIKELPKLIKFAKTNKIPYLVIGRGSNILFDDKGFRGLIIQNSSSGIKFNKNFVTANSGVIISKLVQESVKKGLSPLEKWAMLPGTVGGAVYGNAGCNGLEIKDILSEAKIFSPKTNKIKKVKAKYFSFKYRDSKLKKSNEILLQATFKLQKSKLSGKEQREIMATLSKKRFASQPLGLSAGSFFKNPSPSNPAGLLIDKAGLKGKIIGKAQVSEKHANFILNLGSASSKDIIDLARLIKKIVKEKFNISLVPEVQIYSEKGSKIIL